MRRAAGEAVILATLVLTTFFGVFYFDKVKSSLNLYQLYNASTREPITTLTPGTTQADKLQRVTVFADGQGHFQAIAEINGGNVDFVIDTGATAVALTYEDAKRLHLDKNLKFTGNTQTANGITKVAPIIINEIKIGDIVIKNVRAHVSEPRKLGLNLLGMSFIQRLERFELRGQQLTMER